MRKIFSCRRSSLALVSILLLAGLGFYTPAAIEGIAVAIAGIVTAVSGSNAWEKRGTQNK